MTRIDILELFYYLFSQLSQNENNEKVGKKIQKKPKKCAINWSGQKKTNSVATGSRQWIGKKNALISDCVCACVCLKLGESVCECSDEYVGLCGGVYWRV